MERTSWELSWPELYRRSGAATGRRSEDLDSCGQLEPAGHSDRWVRTRYESGPPLALTRERSVGRSFGARWSSCSRTARYQRLLDGVDEHDRVAAIDRLHELVRGGSLSLERFSAILEQVLAAVGHADLEAAMSALPPVVRLTPASRRLAQPLVLRADGALKLGSGWQLAADTTISVAFGTAWLDLTAASWDANSDQPPSGDPGGCDRGHRPRRRGRADGRRVRTRPAGVAVCAPPRRPALADLDLRANRGDPHTPPEETQSRAIHPLEATAKGGQPSSGKHQRLPNERADMTDTIECSAGPQGGAGQSAHQEERGRRRQPGTRGGRRPPGGGPGCACWP